jgi:superfamily I DNA and/or RNA helicase
MLDGVPEAAGIEVSTIDSFQGREADAVILSMV